MQSTPSGRNDFTQPELYRIASQIPDKWQEIARLTKKFDDPEIANINLDISCHDHVQKATRMLNDYMKRLGSREVLVSALEETQKIELAEKVRSKHYQKYKLNGTEDRHDEKLETKLEKIDLKDGPSPSDDDSAAEAPVVFISYKWAIQEKVVQLMEKIESRGIKCWMDKNAIEGGDVLSKEFDKGIRGCKVMVSCVTNAYNESDYCLKELALADNQKKAIIPLLFESMDWPPPGHLYFRADLVYIKCQDRLTYEKLEEIVKTIESKLSYVAT